MARNTAQAHLDKLTRTGVIVGFGPEIDLRKVGYAVSAFVSLEIAQGRGGPVDEHLEAIPEIVEAWMTTGTSDLLCRVVARDNDHLGHVINQILEVPGVTPDDDGAAAHDADRTEKPAPGDRRRCG